MAPLLFLVFILQAGSKAEMSTADPELSSGTVASEPRPSGAGGDGGREKAVPRRDRRGRRAPGPRRPGEPGSARAAPGKGDAGSPPLAHLSSLFLASSVFVRKTKHAYQFSSSFNSFLNK